MSLFDWFDHWTHHHTEIAIKTQSNFIYTQNTVVRRLNKESPNFKNFLGFSPSISEAKPGRKTM